MRADVEKDLGEKFERIKKEKNELENKLFNKKREMKELEQNFTKQNQLNEKEKNELMEKHNSLQKKFDELNTTYNNERLNNEKQISILNKEKDSFKTSQTSNEQKLKNKIYELEASLLEKISQYEKDKVLWEGKLKLIEQQKDTLKKIRKKSTTTK